MEEWLAERLTTTIIVPTEKDNVIISDNIIYNANDVIEERNEVIE